MLNSQFQVNCVDCKINPKFEQVKFASVNVEYSESSVPHGYVELENQAHLEIAWIARGPSLTLRKVVKFC
jgi:hypothetical protein